MESCELRIDEEKRDLKAGTKHKPKRYKLAIIKDFRIDIVGNVYACVHSSPDLEWRMSLRIMTFDMLARNLSTDYDHDISHFGAD